MLKFKIWFSKLFCKEHVLYSKLLKMLLKTTVFNDFSDFDNFKDRILKEDLRFDSELVKEDKYIPDMEESESDYVNPKIEEAYYGHESYKKEMFKALFILFYSEIEIKLKRILSTYDWSFRIGKKRISSFDFPNIIKAFKKLFEVNIKGIENFSDFDELRELNNCLKHKEIVSNELEQINGSRWHQGEKIDLTKDDLERLLTKSKEFYKNLLDELKKNLAEA